MHIKKVSTLANKTEHRLYSDHIILEFQTQSVACCICKHLHQYFTARLLCATHWGLQRGDIPNLRVSLNTELSQKRPSFPVF